MAFNINGNAEEFLYSSWRMSTTVATAAGPGEIRSDIVILLLVSGYHSVAGKKKNTHGVPVVARNVRNVEFVSKRPVRPVNFINYLSVTTPRLVEMRRGTTRGALEKRREFQKFRGLGECL